MINIRGQSLAWTNIPEILKLGHVARDENFHHPLAVLLGRNPAVNQSLTQRLQRLIAIIIGCQPLGPLIFSGHALHDIVRPIDH